MNTLNECLNCVFNSDYVKNYSSPTVKRHQTSLSYLVNRPLSQGECIKLGQITENTFRIIIENNTKYINIRPTNKKGKKERDILFLDEENKRILYAEVKSNINLDTEKSLATCNKCKEISIELEQEYPDYEIVWMLLCSRYTSVNDISSTYKNKFKSIKDHLVGVNEFLTYFGIKYQFSNDEYKNYINKLVEECFNNS